MARKPRVFTPEPRRMCGGKYCYPNHHEAEAVIAEKQITDPDISLSMYRCHECHTWHLTRSLGNRES